MVVPNGWLSGLSPLLDHLSVTLFCMMAHTNIITIVVQFVFRARVVCEDEKLVALGFSNLLKNVSEAKRTIHRYSSALPPGAFCKRWMLCGALSLTWDRKSKPSGCVFSTK